MDGGLSVHIGGAKQFRPDVERERARAAWLLAIDLADEGARAGFLKVYDPPRKVGRGSTAGVSMSRRIALYLATTIADVSSRPLADASGFHRSTISHHVEIVEDLREDPAFDARLSELERRFLYRAACIVTAALGLDLSATSRSAT